MFGHLPTACRQKLAAVGREEYLEGVRGQEREGKGRGRERERRVRGQGR